MVGTWASSTSPEHQLHLVLSHTFLLRSSSALLPLWSAVKETGLRWDKASSTPDVDPAFPQHSSHARQESLDGINAELAVLLAILYFMLEVFRGDEGWADELSEWKSSAKIGGCTESGFPWGVQCNLNRQCLSTSSISWQLCAKRMPRVIL